MRAVTTGAPARRRWVVARAAVGLAAAGLVAGACSQTDVPASLPGPTTTTTVPAPDPAPADPTVCNPDTVTRSLRPDAPALAALETGDFVPGSTMAEIRDRGRLRVGVDTSTLRFSNVNPSTGGFEGFDIDIAREVAAALFGSPEKIEFVAIPYSERVNVLVASEVDIVVDTFTINCAREQQIDFSTEYFRSSQKLLVPLDAGVTRIEDLAGEPVCAAAGSTSIDNINALPEDQRPVAVGVTEQADCLVLLQQGRVAGISTDDTILAGMVAQDPNVTIVGDPFSQEPYGVGLPPDRPESVRYVNAVLDRVRSSGRWNELYNQWLARLLPEQNVTPPAAQYED
jgi:polar amino acid transport system substrate-binding protein